jgi:DNA-binding MarR family transcriptional regulator
MVRGLQAEIGQTKPFSSTAEEAYLNLLRTTDALVRSHILLLRQYDLTPSQYNALRILRGAGTDGVTCGEMSDRLLTRDPDVTRLIDRLEKRGLIQRSREASDRRVVRGTITPAGLAVLAALDAPMKAWLAEHLGPVPELELRGLISVLERLRHQCKDS